MRRAYVFGGRIRRDARQPHVRRTRSQRRRGHDRYAPISIARSPHPFTASPSPRLICLHINRAFPAPIHGLAESMIDMPPYQSRVRRMHSRRRRVHDRYALISIARSPNAFTASPRPRLICPYINRAFPERIHGIAEATIDIPPYQSHVPRTRSQSRPRPRLICPYINRAFPAPVHTVAGATIGIIRVHRGSKRRKTHVQR